MEDTTTEGNMIKKIIAYLKEKKERRRQKKADKFMFKHALSSYDFFIGLDDEK